MEESLIIAIISFFFSLISLVWNIARDVFLDIVNLEMRFIIGEEIIDDRNRGRMVSAGSGIEILGVEKVIQPKKVFFKITNIGRRDIEIEKIKADYKNGKGWLLPIDEHRYLKPYESTTASTENSGLIENLKHNDVKLVYVIDAKGKRWKFSNKDIKDATALLKENS